MKTIIDEKYEFTLPTRCTLTLSDKPTADWLQGLIDGNAEAVRLLTEVAETVPNMSIELEQAINAYLAKAKK